MKPMLLEDILYTQGFGTRRVCAGLLEKGLVQVYTSENSSKNDENETIAGVFTASKATECIAKGLRFKVQGEDWEYHEKAYVLFNKPMAASVRKSHPCTPASTHFCHHRCVCVRKKARFKACKR
jgi:16S rRNA pseudouridine516 synthase